MEHRLTPLVAVLVFVACADANETGEPGKETGPCIDFECLGGELVCLSNLCVGPDSGDDSDSSPPADDGDDEADEADEAADGVDSSSMPDSASEDGSSGSDPTECGADETLCGQECADLTTSTSHCGECGNALPPNTSCVGGEPACEGRDLLPCEAGCLSPLYDDDNCGACGFACVDVFECRLGHCSFDIPSPSTNTTCATVCSNAGYDCLEATANYYGTVYCDVGGGSSDHAEFISCATVPEEFIDVVKYNGCEFLGEVTDLQCRCLQP